MRKTDTPALLSVRAALQMIGVEPAVLDDESIRDSVLHRLCTLVTELKADREKQMTRGQAESHVIALALEAGVPTRPCPLGRGVAFADERLAELLQRCLADTFGDARG